MIDHLADKQSILSMVLLIIVGLVMALLAVLFAFQNAAIVTVNFFGLWQLEQSLAIVLIITLGLGIIISLLLSLPTIWRRGWRNSQQRAKIEELQEQIKAKNLATLQNQQQNLAQQEANQELLNALGLTDPITGVLTKDTSIKLTEYLGQLMQQQIQNPRYASLLVLLLSLDPAKSQRSFADIGSENAVYKAIAKRLKEAVLSDSFLGITERKRFISLISGLQGGETAEYVDYLQNKITESPLQKADGVLLPLKMSVGGVIVEPTDSLNSRDILKQAEQNLEKSLARGKGSSEITEVSVS